MNEEIVWHNDGHAIHLTLRQDVLEITRTECPNGHGSELAPCWHAEAKCIVTWFLDRYGLEVNVGVSAPTPRMEIAWGRSGSTWDLDTMQVWTISIEDDFFAAWVDSQTTTS